MHFFSFIFLLESWHWLCCSQYARWPQGGGAGPSPPEDQTYIWHSQQEIYKILEKRKKEIIVKIQLLWLFSHPVVSNSATPGSAAHQASLSLTISQSLPKFMSIASVMPFVIPFRDHCLVVAKGLHNSVKLWAMLCRATHDGWVIVESSDKTRSTGVGNGKPPQYTCRENLMNCIKRQKIQLATY